MRAAVLLAGVLALLVHGAAPARQSSSFKDWAAVVVAGDWRASGGGETKAFENARRDVSEALLRSGFRQENLVTLGVDATDPQAETTGRNFLAGFRDAAARAPSGCFAYFTSHGSPAGIAFGRRGKLAPAILDGVLDRLCGERPTVVFVSACYSGVFVPSLAAPNRMVFTAARPDRNSFGCGEGDRYPFFDACVLESWPAAADFAALGRAVQACVARREGEMKLSPASEPQMFVGAGVKPLIPLLRLSPAPAAAR